MKKWTKYVAEQIILMLEVINGIFFFKNFTPDFLIDQLNNTFVVGFDESEETRKSGWFILIMQIFLS